MSVRRQLTYLTVSLERLAGAVTYLVLLAEVIAVALPHRTAVRVLDYTNPILFLSLPIFLFGFIGAALTRMADLRLLYRWPERLIRFSVPTAAVVVGLINHDQFLTCLVLGTAATLAIVLEWSVGRHGRMKGNFPPPEFRDQR